MGNKKKLVKKEMIKEMEVAIKAKKIAFFDHIFAYTTFSRASAYNRNLDKLDSLRELINKNKVSAKNCMINNWISQKSNATLQIAAFRLMSTPEEHKLLNQQYIDHTTDGNKLKGPEKIQIEVIGKNEVIEDGES